MGKAADWNKWAYVLTSEIWQAVALSLDIEPHALPGLDFRPIIGGPFDSCPEEFRRRLDIARNHVEGGVLKCTAHAGSRPHDTVSLSVFAAWAQSLGWSLPDSFPRKSKKLAKQPQAVVDRSAYEARIAKFNTDHGRDPPLQTTKNGLEGDREWAVRNRISRKDITSWRRELLQQKIGRPKS
jgi:hypothetical protein